MSDDFYPFVDSGDPAPDNAHLTGTAEPPTEDSPAQAGAEQAAYACRIAVYDDMLSTPRVLVIAPRDVRTYLEEVTNTVYACMKEQGGSISLMVIREIVENFIHAHFMEPIISVLDAGNTIRFADQGPGIEDKERAFEFGVTSADRGQKRYIRGTGAGFPMVQQYLENAGGAVSIEDNLHQGTVVTVSVDPARVAEIERARARGGAVRGGAPATTAPAMMQGAMQPGMTPVAAQQLAAPQPAAIQPGAAQPATQAMPLQPVAASGPFGEAPNPAAAEGTPVTDAALMAGAQAGAPGVAYGMQAYSQASPYPYQQGYPAAGWPQPGYTPYPGYPTGSAYGMPATQMPMAGGYPQAAGYPYQPQHVPMMQPGMQAPAMAGSAGMAPAAGTPGSVYVSDRGMLAMQYLQEHASCGPTDLARAFGSSNPTWSRELENLKDAGLVIKRGQKHVLTEMGTLWLQNR